MRKLRQPIKETKFGRYRFKEITAIMTIENTNQANSSKRRRALIGTTLAFIIVIALYSAYYLLVLTQREETDNAYVGGNLVMLTSQIAGSVREIHADETQLVEAGAEIVKLDTVDSEVALSKAEAQLGATVRQLREQYAGVGQYEALVQQRKLGLQKAEEDLARRAPLAADHTLSAEEVTHARQRLPMRGPRWISPVNRKWRPAPGWRVSILSQASGRACRQGSLGAGLADAAAYINSRARCWLHRQA